MVQLHKNPKAYEVSQLRETSRLQTLKANILTIIAVCLAVKPQI